MSFFQIIVCASGKSTRFASNKLLHVLPSGKTILETTLSNIKAGVGDQNCLVVLPPNQKQMIEIVENSGYIAKVLNPQSSGIGETISFAVQQSKNALGWLICLADMPGISPETYQAVISKCSESMIVAPSYNGKRGHPVFFPKHFYSRLIKLSGDKGAASIIRSCQDRLELIDVRDRSSLEDIDTIADARRFSGD